MANDDPVTVVLRAKGIIGPLTYTVRTAGDALRLVEAEKAHDIEVISVTQVKRRYSDDVLRDIARLRK